MNFVSPSNLSNLKVVLETPKYAMPLCNPLLLSVDWTFSFLAKKISQKWWDVHSEISLYISWGFHSGCFFLNSLPREKTAVMSWDTSKEKLTYESPAATYMCLEMDVISVDSLTAIPQETLSQRYSVKLCSDSWPGNGEVINFVVLSC